MIVKITKILSIFSITYISSFVFFYREILSLLRWMEGMVVVYHAEDAKEAIPVLVFHHFSPVAVVWWATRGKYILQRLSLLVNENISTLHEKRFWIQNINCK